MNTIFSRRDAIKGLTLGAAAPLLGPMVSQLAARAAGGPGAVRQRFVFVVQSNGIEPNHIVPIGLPQRKHGPIFDNAATQIASLKDHELPAPIAGLTPFKDRLTLVQGLSGCSSEGGTGGHSTNQGALGCYPGNQGPMAQTIDCALGDAFPGIIRHVGLGVMSKKEHTLNFNISCAGPGKPAPLQCDQDMAYRSLFGSVIGGGDRSAFDHRTRLLDFVAQDVRRTRAALAGEERAKLDEYLAPLETLRQRQGAIEALEPRLRAAVPKLDLAPYAEVKRIRANFDIAAAVLISGLSQCVTLASGGGGQNYLAYPDLGIPIDGHAVGHGQSANGMNPEAIHVKVRQFHCSLIAELAGKLAAVPEGDGTMLDHTLIVYLSDSGDGHHPSLRAWPIVLLGGMGGKLKPGGRYVQLPKYGAKGHRTLSNFYLTLLEAAGKPRDAFGVPDTGLRDIDQSGLVKELLA